jgi:predicted secreted protein
MEIVKLKQGDQHVVRLRGLATAGYEWIYENSDQKTANVEKAMAEEPVAGGNLGGSSMEQFTVTALKKGEAILRFSHVRQWENKAPREEKLVKLVIE